jgi:NitT/TauT family transport system permease protein
MNGKLAVDLAATLSRVFLGVACGAVPGLILGLIIGRSHRLRAIIDPFVAAAHPVPKIALLPIIMIVFGIGETSKVMVVAMAAFFPVAINAIAGVRQISPIHFEVAANYGATPLKVFTRVVMPGSLPLVLAGMRLALNAALLVTIAVELVAAQNGLGVMVWFAWQTLRTEELYASVAVAAALGVGFNLFLRRLEILLVPWQVERET